MRRGLFVLPHGVVSRQQCPSREDCSCLGSPSPQGPFLLRSGNSFLPCPALLAQLGHSTALSTGSCPTSRLPLHQGSTNQGPGARFCPKYVLVNKVLLETTSIHFCAVYGCFLHLTAEQLKQRPHGLQSCRYLRSGSLQKNVPHTLTIPLKVIL